jgi:hypothetical protein
MRAKRAALTLQNGAESQNRVSCGFCGLRDRDQTVGGRYAKRLDSTTVVEARINPCPTRIATSRIIHGTRRRYPSRGSSRRRFEPIVMAQELASSTQLCRIRH